MALHIIYGKYKLSKLVSIEEIVSADYVEGEHVARFPHSHKDAWEVVYCMQNVMKVFVGNSWIDLKKGETFFVRPGIIHDILITSGDSRCFVVSFTCNSVEFMTPLEGRIITPGPEEQELFLMMKQEIETTFSKNPGNLHLYTFEPSVVSPLGAEQMICCYIEQLIIRLLREVTSQDGLIVSTSEIRNAVQDYLIDQINTYISAHFDEGLTVEKVASAFHYSRTRFSTIYKRITGQSVSEVIGTTMINYAKELLRHNELSITEISEKSGFSSPQYFSHKFSDVVGCSPSEFAKNAADGRDKNGEKKKA